MAKVRVKSNPGVLKLSGRFHEPINDPEYKYWVVRWHLGPTGARIHSGWEYREDAVDALNELHDEVPGVQAKVYAMAGMNQLGLNPWDNKLWETGDMSRNNPCGSKKRNPRGLGPAFREAIERAKRATKATNYPHYVYKNSRGEYTYGKDLYKDKGIKKIWDMSGREIKNNPSLYRSAGIDEKFDPSLYHKVILKGRLPSKETVLRGTAKDKYLAAMRREYSYLRKIDGHMEGEYFVVDSNAEFTKAGMRYPKNYLKGMRYRLPGRNNPRRKSMRDFIRENREEIDRAILRVCPNCRLNNDEREMWIRNDEGLYSWARSEGVSV